MVKGTKDSVRIVGEEEEEEEAGCQSHPQLQFPFGGFGIKDYDAALAMAVYFC